MNDDLRYGLISQSLHWLTMGLVVALVIMGKAGNIDADHPDTSIFLWHSSLGLLVLVLTAVRLLWRLFNAPPAQPQTTSRWGRRAAGLVHFGLYALLLALPLSGWLAASSEGAAVSFFGLIRMPAAPPLAEGAEELHEVLGDALLVLIGIHLLAALKHHWFDRDEVLKRMLPQFSGTPSGSLPNTSAAKLRAGVTESNRHPFWRQT
jgi:cytochrome b561